MRHTYVPIGESIDTPTTPRKKSTLLPEESNPEMVFNQSKSVKFVFIKFPMK